MRILLVVAIVLIAFTTGMGFLRGHPAGENVLAGISAAIAAIPEEPPVLLAVMLGLGAYRLLKRGVLVRRLNAEETLGAVDLIVTDKTGTITQNRLVVASVRTPDGEVDDPAARLALLEEALRAEEDAWPGEDVAAGLVHAVACGRRWRRSAARRPSTPGDLVDAEPADERDPVTRTRARRPDGSVEELALGAPEVVLARGRRPDRRSQRWAELGDRVGRLRRAAGRPRPPRRRRAVGDAGPRRLRGPDARRASPRR